MIINKPPTVYYLKQAAGITKAAAQPGKFEGLRNTDFHLTVLIIYFMFLGNEIAGKITLRHLYEIAKIKSEDVAFECVPLKDIVQGFVGIARSCGIEIVRHLDPEEYGEFLKERAAILAQKRKELDEIKAAKVLRTAT